MKLASEQDRDTFLVENEMQKNLYRNNTRNMQLIDSPINTPIYAMSFCRHNTLTGPYLKMLNFR